MARAERLRKAGMLAAAEASKRPLERNSRREKGSGRLASVMGALPCRDW
jgi:hypothetical protein